MNSKIIENAEKILYLESILDDKTGTVLEMLGVAKSLESTKKEFDDELSKISYEDLVALRTYLKADEGIKLGNGENSSRVNELIEKVDLHRS
ncbi:MAG TPA: hypothetical protein PLB45_03080 [Bacilli bacterium]|jgi:hypothetical protein|nr:hypothetical protein [Bacilli bacterium]HPZ23744.1 hypothetical protein [Bacilli bacterium]HQC83836.1 hypothetical protein [Bacilli bacterium]